MKKIFIVCAFLSALSLNANAQVLSGLLKSLAGGNKTVTKLGLVKLADITRHYRIAVYIYDLI